MNEALKDLIGLTITEFVGLEEGSDSFTVLTKEGRTFRGYHMQDCCESVDVQRVFGDGAASVLNQPVFGVDITEDSEGHPEDVPENQRPSDSWTWTTWFIKTANAQLIIRWLGQSNGYYGERPYFSEV